MKELVIGLALILGKTMCGSSVEIEKGHCKIDGKEIPPIGFGTYPLRKKTCTHAVEEAIADGYVIIDTATYYRNFKAIGKAVKYHNRSDLYLTSKVWYDDQTPKKINKDIKKTLKNLKTDYVDAYLIHWPNSTLSIEKTLAVMDELRKEGLIRHIGLSNVTVNHLKRALEVGIPITWVQVEMHPYFYDKALLEFCKEHKIGIQAWRPLNLGQVKDDPLLSQIGGKYGKTPSQVSLRWILQHDCIPLPGSKNPKHIKENFAIFDFTLSAEDMARIDERASKGSRYRITEERGIGFTDEFDFSYEECWPHKTR